MHIKRIRLRAPGRHRVHVYRGAPRDGRKQELNRGKEPFTAAKLNARSRGIGSAVNGGIETGEVYGVLLGSFGHR